MLSIIGPGSNRTCEGRTRREFLQIGTLGIGGLTLPALLAAQHTLEVTAVLSATKLLSC